jgi:hypothetical protein
MNTNTPPLTDIQNSFTMEFWACPQKGFAIPSEDPGGLANTGTFVGWGVVSGKKRCWVGDFGGCTLYTFAGAGKQTFTVLGQAGQNTDPGGSPSFWSAVYQGQNTQLTIGTRKYYSFPSVLSGTMTEIYPDPNTGNLIRYESSSSYSFAASATQTANNTGETTADLINALIKTLTAQGYKSLPPGTSP